MRGLLSVGGLRFALVVVVRGYWCQTALVAVVLGAVGRDGVVRDELVATVGSGHGTADEEADLANAAAPHRIAVVEGHTELAKVTLGIVEAVAFLSRLVVFDDDEDEDGDGGDGGAYALVAA